jgi:hypothetical protein
MSKKVVAGALAALTMAGTLALTSTEASAQWRRGYGWGPGAVAAGVFGGLALGALAARPYYYGPPGYYAYGYGPDCYVTRRRVWVEGYGWTLRRVTVC